MRNSLLNRQRVIVSCLVLAAAGTSIGLADDTPFLTRRATFQTKLRRYGRSPGNAKDPETRPGYTRVTYRSGGNKLKAWAYAPADASARNPRPAIVHFHGGFGVSRGHFFTAAPFVKAGFVVMLPALRAENGNPGDFEMWLGEVDDAIAAVKWLSRQRIVDSKRVYAFGHSAGGIVSSLLSLMPDVPIQHSGSCGAVYDKGLFIGIRDKVPFDMSNPQEMELRLLLGNQRWMKRPHYAYYGKQDAGVLSGVAAFRREMEQMPLESLLKIDEVDGDHFKSLTPAMEAYIQLIRSEQAR